MAECPATKKQFHAVLVDDGTLDTVIKCSQCGEVYRYSFGETEDDRERVDTYKKYFLEDHEVN